MRIAILAGKAGVAIAFLICTQGLPAREPGVLTPPPASHTHARAGYPRSVSRLAQVSTTAANRGYYVGGGKVLGRPSRMADHGTWGWDYNGWVLPRRLALGWGGRHHQGGTGAYSTSGGPQVPDIIAAGSSFRER